MMGHRADGSGRVSTGVGKAAERPPALVILSLNAHLEAKSVALVGKGIIYDTGGLSIKTKTGMPGMGPAKVACGSG